MLALNTLCILLRKKLVIIASGYGRWGNRLMLFTYAICWAEKNGAIVLNPSFREYSKYFTYFMNNNLCSVPFLKHLNILFIKLIVSELDNSFSRIPKRKGILLERIVNTLYLSGKDQETESSNFLCVLKKNRVVFLDGFIMGNRNFDLVKKHHNELTSIFTFIPEIQDTGQQIIKPLIEKNKILMGVCMRQGDYKTFRKGFFYLEDEKYLQLIKLLQIQFNDNINFFIASEERNKTFDVKENILINCESPALNIHILSLCDYLIGPPSTFMTWSSFYHSTPVCYIDSTDWKRDKYRFDEATF